MLLCAKCGVGNVFVLPRSEVLGRAKRVSETETAFMSAQEGGEEETAALASCIEGMMYGWGTSVLPEWTLNDLIPQGIDLQGEDE